MSFLYFFQETLLQFILVSQKNLHKKNNVFLYVSIKINVISSSICFIILCLSSLLVSTKKYIYISKNIYFITSYFLYLFLLKCIFVFSIYFCFVLQEVVIADNLSM